MSNASKNPQNSQYPLVSVNLVVHNGEKYIRRCLDSVLAQSYPRELIEVNVLDNNSSDFTKEIIKKEFPEFNLVESEKNLGMWPGQEELLKHSRVKYIIVLSVDVTLDAHFIEEAIRVFEKDEKIGAVQPKVYKWKLPNSPTSNIQPLTLDVIDTCGFKIFRSRKIINIGHGDKNNLYRLRLYRLAKTIDETIDEIFAAEGAAPVFRRQALEDCRLKSQGDKVIDPDFFWYGDDLDLAWRMRLFGWKQVFAPKVIAWHDRQTTKALAGG
ncbi:MAG: glycosyltransferase, partial [Patescibacteria group bacterium]